LKTIPLQEEYCCDVLGPLPFQCPCFTALFTDQHEYFSDTGMISGITDSYIIMYSTPVRWNNEKDRGQKLILTELLQLDKKEKAKF